jgi:hypothetical protein
MANFELAAGRDRGARSKDTLRLFENSQNVKVSMAGFPKLIPDRRKLITFFSCVSELIADG